MSHDWRHTQTNVFFLFQKMSVQWYPGFRSSGYRNIQKQNSPIGSPDFERNLITGHKKFEYRRMKYLMIWYLDDQYPCCFDTLTFESLDIMFDSKSAFRIPGYHCTRNVIILGGIFKFFVHFIAAFLTRRSIFSFGLNVLKFVSIKIYCLTALN